MCFKLPSIASLRIIFISWLLACLVLRSSYSGCLNSLMAFQSNIKTIDTLTELSNLQTKGEIQVTATKSSAYDNHWKYY